MRAPKKVIAAMAVATLLGTGVGQAFAADSETAAPKTPDFTANSGDLATGQKASQKTKKHDKTEGKLTDEIKKNLTSVGDIEINGEFSKTVNSFPKPNEDGRYIQVTMPLSLSYSYNLTNNAITSATTGSIVNESVYAQNTGADNPDLVSIEEQPVLMSFVGLNGSTDNGKVEYVKETSSAPDKVELPIQLIISNGEEVKGIPFASIKKQEVAPILIEAGNSLDLRIDKIGKQKVVGPSGFDEDLSSVKDNMTLKFEYAGE